MSRQKLYAVPFLVFLLGVVALPLGSVLVGSFQAQDGPLAHYRAILSNAFHLYSFYTSLWLSAATALLGVLVALPMSIRLRQASRPLREWALVFGNLGANFSGVPLVLSFIMLFGANGVLTGALLGSGLVDRVNLYSIGGLFLTYSFFQVSLAVVLLLPVVLSVPAELVEAAVLMGTSAGRFWRRIGLPLIARQIASVALLLFANAMGTYATAYALIGTNARVVTVRIGELVAGDVFSEPGLANALSVCLLAVLLISIALGQSLLKERPCPG